LNIVWKALSQTHGYQIDVRWACTTVQDNADEVVEIRDYNPADAIIHSHFAREQN